MIKQKAEELIKGLTAPQQRTFRNYFHNLSTDKNRHFTDEKVVEVIKRYGVSKPYIHKVLKYLDEIGFTQSSYEYSQIKKQLKRFQEANHPYFGWNRNFIKAKSDLIRSVQKWNLNILSYGGNVGMMDSLPRRDTHAGWSWILTGNKHKGEYADEVHNHYREFEKEARLEGSFNRPILIGARTQASGAYDANGVETHKFVKKTRLVSMIDIFVIFAELKFSKRFQFRMGETPWYAGGKDDNVILAQLNTWNNKYKHWLCIDYSSFDQTISSWLINEAFDIVKAAYNRWTWDEELFEIVKKDFICKCFIDGSGSVVDSVKGVPSGSMFTQIIDSLVNNLVIRTFLYSKNISDFEMMIMGDDNIIFTNVELNSDELSSYLHHNFGLEVNSTKCRRKTKDKPYPQFLSREWNPAGVYRPTFELIPKLVYPERYRDYGGTTNEHHVIWSYIRAFPRGMDQIIDVERYSRDHYVKIGQDHDCGEYKWMSGLMRYRMLYT